MDIFLHLIQEAEGSAGAWKPSSLERLACAALEALELSAGAASAVAAAGASGTSGAAAFAVGEGGAEAARKLLCAPAGAHLHARAQCLLRALHHTHYHQYKVKTITLNSGEILYACIPTSREATTRHK